MNTAIGILFGVFLVWWVFIKHDPRKFHWTGFGLGYYEEDKETEKDENEESQ